MSVIVGIDPGSRVTGYGVIRQEGQGFVYLASGVIKMSESRVEDRVKPLYEGLMVVLEQYRPMLGAVEQVFVHKNPKSALVLGHARGVAVLALRHFMEAVFSFSPREVKKSVVGYGNAEKDQVQSMVKYHLGLTGELQEDASDALAVALSCAFTRRWV